MEILIFNVFILFSIFSKYSNTNMLTLIRKKIDDENVGKNYLKVNIGHALYIF